MRIPRIHVEGALQGGMTVALPEQAGEHVARVLRLEPGHSIVLFNGDGFEYEAQLVSVAKRSVTAQVDAQREFTRESPLHLTLVQGIARGDKMDWILQKATELGVAHIVPIFTERTEVKLDEDRAGKRLTHWRQVVIAACEQSGRVQIPQIDAPARLAVWAGSLATAPGERLALLPSGEITSRNIEWISDAAWLVVGPEGGLSDKDEIILRHAGFRGLRLGPRILRTETAGIAALAALQTLRGDMG